MWTVVFHPSAEKELGALSAPDRVAVLHAAEKLAALGPTLPIRIRATSAVDKVSGSCALGQVAAGSGHCTHDWATPS